MKLPDTTPDFQKSDGLVPVIVQDIASSAVLMLGYMNEEAYRTSIDTGFVHFYSRNKKRLWKKGETSGNTLSLRALVVDCDGDTILASVVPAGPVCHTGTMTCFGDVQSRNGAVLTFLEELIRGRRAELPEGSYVAQLFSGGLKRIAQKVHEEAGEAVIEAIDGDKTRFAEEVSDLIFHLLVLLREMDVDLETIYEILARRNR